MGPGASQAGLEIKRPEGRFVRAQGEKTHSLGKVIRSRTVLNQLKDQHQPRALRSSLGDTDGEHGSGVT